MKTIFIIYMFVVVCRTLVAFGAKIIVEYSDELICQPAQNSPETVWSINQLKVFKSNCPDFLCVSFCSLMRNLICNNNLKVSPGSPVKADQLIDYLCVWSGGEITSTFDHPELVKLGHCKLIEEVMIGEDMLIHFSGVAMGTAPSSCSILLFFYIIKWSGSWTPAKDASLA